MRHEVFMPPLCHVCSLTFFSCFFSSFLALSSCFSAFSAAALSINFTPANMLCGAAKVELSNSRRHCSCQPHAATNVNQGQDQRPDA